MDYLVVGAGATGMAFTDTLIDHADVRVALVDRRETVGGHWLEAYPFVRLHQASQFYGVASTVLGGGIQQDGPEAGSTSAPTRPRSAVTTTVSSTTGCSPRAGSSCSPGPTTSATGRSARVGTGRLHTVPDHCRIVDAALPLPRHPGQSPAPFAVADDAHVVPVNDVVSLEDAPSQDVVAGSGKTATDTIIWLLNRGVDPDAICWVRPRDPWMLNRALIQPDRGHLPRDGRGDAEICAGAPSLPEGVPRARGRRDHAAHRPRHDAHHGAGAHARHVGARPAAQPSSTSSASATSARCAAAGSSSRVATSRSPGTPWSSTARRTG